MNAKGQPFYPGNYSGNKYQLGANSASRDDGRMLIWDASRVLQEGFLAHGAELSRLMELAHNLSQHLENTRAKYNRALTERDAAHRRLQDANNKLTQVENLVKRYAVVRDPVIASDGFTYESESITKYLEECSSGNSKAYSQQTKEELTDVTVPNKSLSRLVAHLREVRPVEVPPLVHRAPITAIPSVIPPRTVWADEDNAAGMISGEPLNAAIPQSTGVGTMPPLSAGPASGGIMVPAPASAGGNAGGRGAMTNRFDPSGKMCGARPALHPCLRVYGFCNFMDDCTFANYPFEACLNHIKGKCRFGHNCKELHVDPRNPRFHNPRGYVSQHGHNGTNGDGQPHSTNTTAATGDAEVATEQTAVSGPEDQVAGSAPLVEDVNKEKAGTQTVMNDKTAKVTEKVRSIAADSVEARGAAEKIEGEEEV